MELAMGCNYKYGTNRVKCRVVKFVMGLLGKALQEVSKIDEEVKEEIKALPEGFVGAMFVLPDGPSMAFKKEGDRLRYLGTDYPVDEADLVIMFKNLESAYMVMTAQLSTHKAYAQHRISVKGDLVNAMIITRCLNIVQAYLFPGPLGKLVLKRPLPMPLERQLNRLKLFAMLPLGK